MPTSDSSSAPPLGSTGDLLAAATQGEESAWVALLECFSTTVNAVARSCRLNGHDVEDVVQTTWLALIENAHRIRNPEALRAWLITTARRECLRVIRTSGRERAMDPSELPERATTCSVSERLIQRERDDVMRRATENLPPHQRVLLKVLSVDPPPTYEQVSEVLRMPIGSIGPTRGRALASLRRDNNLIDVIGD